MLRRKFFLKSIILMNCLQMENVGSWKESNFYVVWRLNINSKIIFFVVIVLVRCYYFAVILWFELANLYDKILHLLENTCMKYWKLWELHLETGNTFGAYAKVLNKIKFVYNCRKLAIFPVIYVNFSIR